MVEKQKIYRRLGSGRSGPKGGLQKQNGDLMIKLVKKKLLISVAVPHVIRVGLVIIGKKLIENIIST